MADLSWRWLEELFEAWRIVGIRASGDARRQEVTVTLARRPSGGDQQRRVEDGGNG